MYRQSIKSGQSLSRDVFQRRQPAITHLTKLNVYSFKLSFLRKMHSLPNVWLIREDAKCDRLWLGGTESNQDEYHPEIPHCPQVDETN